jgi:hypothetical protein
MYGAGATLRDPAAVFSASESDGVTQHPEQRGVGFDIDLVGFSVDGKSNHARPPDLNGDSPDKPRSNLNGSDFPDCPEASLRDQHYGIDELIILLQEARKAGSSDPSSSENSTGINSFVVTLPVRSFSAMTSC